MVFIITGGINTGKTTLLERIHRSFGGGGFSLPKIITNNQFKGYWIKDLETGEKTPFALVECNSIYLYRVGRFHILPSGLEFAKSIYVKSIGAHLRDFFIDEIGPLELGNRGFSDIFNDALNNFERVYAVVRNSCLEDVIRVFGLKGYKLIKKDGAS